MFVLMHDPAPPASGPALPLAGPPLAGPADQGTAPNPRSLDELEREIAELAGHLAAAMCRWLLLIAEWDARLGWAEWGVRSCAHWLSWRCSIGLATARDHVRVAKRLNELPLVREAFAGGELSYSKVRAIARVAEPSTEAQLVFLGRHATGAQLEKIVRKFRRATAVSAEIEQDAQDNRYLRWYWDEDGSLRLQARIPAADGGLLLKALGLHEPEHERPADADPAHEALQMGRSNPEHPRHEFADARHADALVATARAALATGSTERTDGDPCQLVVHVDAETLAGDELQSRSEIEDGPALAPETMRRLGCDASVVRIIEQDGRPLTVGRRTRTISRPLRRALRSRDAGCRFPGCTHSRFLHAHHIEHWAKGGRTDLDNLVQLCSFHHRLVHEGGYAVERAGPRSLRFTRPDGQIIPDSCPSVRMRAPHLPVERNACRARSAGEPLDYRMAVDGLIWLSDQDP
jgi:hypothetical protein